MQGLVHIEMESSHATSINQNWLAIEKYAIKRKGTKSKCYILYIGIRFNWITVTNLLRQVKVGDCDCVGDGFILETDQIKTTNDFSGDQ